MGEARAIQSPTEVGLRMGAEGPGVEELQRYLRRFGYLPVEDAGAFESLRATSPAADPISGTLDDVTVEALRAYQDFHGLPPTGELDDATVAQMAIPRCGFPDVPQADIRVMVAAALALWGQVTPLTFGEVPVNESPEIIIRFVAGDHGDGANNAFDGIGGVLAHAFYPPPNGGAIAGDAHFDEAETWSAAIPVPVGRFDLMTLATHEFGHSLGLLHSSVPGAIMRPTFAAGAAQRFLHQDDIDGIQSIYGIGATVPHVQELRAPNAAAMVRAAGLEPRFTGTSGPQAWVWRQSPRGGARVRLGSTVTLQLRTGPIP